MTVAPFNTPEEILGLADRQAQFESGVYDIDSSLNALRLNTNFQKQQIDKGLKENTSGAVNSMIARGLFRSSIKDGDLNDLNATAALRKQYLDTTLNTATLEAGRKKSILNNQFTAFQSYLNKKAVQNAQDVPVVPPPGQGAPAQTGTNGLVTVKPQAAYKTLQNYMSPTGKIGELHVYPSGKKVFVDKSAGTYV